MQHETERDLSRPGAVLPRHSPSQAVAHAPRPGRQHAAWVMARLLVGLLLLGPACLQPAHLRQQSPPVTPDDRIGMGGAGGDTPGGGISLPEGGGDRRDAAPETGPALVVDGAGVLNDARPEAGGSCVADGGGARPGPFPRICAAATTNECDGHSDVNPQLGNGSSGNGFDDDCDGKVDEGCSCGAGSAVGTTKACALVSSSQVDPVTHKPVGWCAQNSVGTVSCIATDAELTRPVWDGECRGAQLPFGDDICGPGDFDCDGLAANSRTQDCRCSTEAACPTDPIITRPYPDPTNLAPIDASAWVTGGVALASNWKWTVTGGDCDNILPRPTFAIYGTPAAVLGGGRLSGDTAQAGLGLNGNQRGYVMGPGAAVGPKIYPAFALSGDYLAKAEWDAGGAHHSCTLKVQVRAPGIRAELCWAPMPQDVDLHFARLQNPKACRHGWFYTCSAGEDGDDCYFDGNTGCSTGFTTNPSRWGYARSPAAACHGWGSSRQAECDNPRLDQDNIDCDVKVSDPMDTEKFCSPENINIDNPKMGDKFAVGVHFYQGATPVHPHVNLYCNGERKLAFGLDATSVPPNNNPVLREEGQEDGGDLWEVATVEAKVDAAGALQDCLIAPVHSKVPKPNKDGSRDMCVDTNPQNGPMTRGVNMWNFTPGGAYPANADQLCWH
jgi:hypothetical protein